MVFTYTFDQLRGSTVEQESLRYMNFEYTMAHGGINADNYFTADSGTIDAQHPFIACEKLYARYNSFDRPKGYTGRSMSVSDIINLWDNEAEPPVKRSFFCDSIGFKEISL